MIAGNKQSKAGEAWMKWILRGIGGLLALVVLAAALIVIDRASLPKAPSRASVAGQGQGL
jgi:acyl-homoserine-lactone acylase